MALEDLTGTRTIDSLVRTNPMGSDFKQFGDDHLRGIKNVLLNTFPNVTGAVTLTHTQLNQAAYFAAGTVMPFFQAAAPTGWTQMTTHADKMLRVVSGAGGGSGGSDSPILMDQVPAHTHSATSGINSVGHTHSGTTGNESVGHTHSGTTADNNLGHVHSTANIAFGDPSAGAGLVIGSNSVRISIGNVTSAGQSSNHTHSFTSAGQSSNHTHSFTSSAQSANHTHAITVNNNAGASNWTPKYIDMILCSKN